MVFVESVWIYPLVEEGGVSPGDGGSVEGAFLLVGVQQTAEPPGEWSGTPLAARDAPPVGRPEKRKLRVDKVWLVVDVDQLELFVEGQLQPIVELDFIG